MLQNRLFFALASRSGFGATISDAVARSSNVFSNSVSADRTVMAASRLLRAVAAFVILLSFAAGSRKSYWSGCMKAATVICQQIFSILALMIFLLKILLKSASKSSFSRMRSKGSRFTLGVWGLECVRSTLRPRPQPFATVRNRPQPFATVRNRSCELRMAVPMGSFAEVVIFGGFRRVVASFRVAGVALCDIQTCFATCWKSFCVAGAILLWRF